MALYIPEAVCCFLKASLGRETTYKPLSSTTRDHKEVKEQRAGDDFRRTPLLPAKVSAQVFLPRTRLPSVLSSNALDLFPMQLRKHIRADVSENDVLLGGKKNQIPLTP